MVIYNLSSIFDRATGERQIAFLTSRSLFRITCETRLDDDAEVIFRRHVFSW